MQPLAQKVKSYIKDSNLFLSKLKSLGKLPQRAILCATDVVGLYSNIMYSEGLTSLQRFLELKDNKQISSDIFIELAEIVLNNNIFEFDEKTFRQVRGKAIGTKFAPPYAILFIADLEEKLLSTFEEKTMIWWRYIDNIFFIWEHGEESMFTAEYSKETINFLDVDI